MKKSLRKIVSSHFHSGCCRGSILLLYLCRPSLDRNDLPSVALEESREYIFSVVTDFPFLTGF